MWRETPEEQRRRGNHGARDGVGGSFFKCADPKAAAD
jgi:hypothetical protein